MLSCYVNYYYQSFCREASCVTTSSNTPLLYVDGIYCIQCERRYIEPLPAGSGTKFEFENMLVGQAVPSNFIPAIEKGFKEAANS
jgi:hypothetical protein